MTFTTEEITGMARAVGAKGLRPYSKRQESDPVVAFRLTPEQLVRLTALVAEKAAAKEREAIAQQVETTEWWKAPKWQSALCPITKSTIAAAIRARGEKEGA